MHKQEEQHRNLRQIYSQKGQQSQKIISYITDQCAMVRISSFLKYYQLHILHRCLTPAIESEKIFIISYLYLFIIVNQNIMHTQALQFITNSCVHQSILIINNNYNHMDPAVQNPSVCSVKISQGADKICISQDCSLQNPFVCSACQQSHQHNGSILTVRVAKVKQIYNKINSAQIQIERVTNQLGYLKNSLSNSIDEFLSNYRNKYADILELNGELNSYLNSDNKNQFFKTWNKIKEINHIFQQKQNIKRQQSVHKLKQELIQTIKNEKVVKVININQDLQANQAEQQQNKIQDSKQISRIQNEFLEHFSNIFCYLPLQIKKKPAQNIIKQITLLEPSSISEKKISAKIYQISQEYQKALELYNSILLQDNLNIQIINRKALLLKRSKRYSQAYDQFTILIDLIKDNTNAEYYHYHKGQICKQLGKYQEALNQYQKCDGKQVVSQSKLDKSMAQLFFKQKKYKQALPLYKKVLTKQENFKIQERNQIFQHLYECGVALSDNSLIIQSLSSLFKNKPQDIQILFKRAKAYHQIKDYNSAIKDYSTAIDRTNKIPGLYYNRAVQLIYSGQSQQAISDLKQAIQLDPNFKQAIHLLANTCFQLLQKAKSPEIAQHLKTLAINSYNYSLKFYPSNQGIWHNLGILETQKTPQRAFQCFSKALQVNPKLIASYLGKVKCAIILKKDASQTMKDLVTLINLGDRSVSTFLLKCILQQQQGFYIQALQTVTLVLKADPQNQIAKQAKQRLNVKAQLMKKQLQKLQSQQKQIEQKK